jgi:hypothetical protein
VDREMESITMKYLGDRSSIDLLFSATYMHELSGGASAGDGEAPRYIEGGEDMLKVMSTVMSSRGNEVRLLQMLPLGNKGDAMDALAMTTVLFRVWWRCRSRALVLRTGSPAPGLGQWCLIGLHLLWR